MGSLETVTTSGHFYQITQSTWLFSDFIWVILQWVASRKFCVPPARPTCQVFFNSRNKVWAKRDSLECSFNRPALPGGYSTTCAKRFSFQLLGVAWIGMKRVLLICPQDKSEVVPTGSGLVSQTDSCAASLGWHHSPDRWSQSPTSYDRLHDGVVNNQTPEEAKGTNLCHTKWQNAAFTRQRGQCSSTGMSQAATHRAMLLHFGDTGKCSNIICCWPIASFAMINFLHHCFEKRQRSRSTRLMQTNTTTSCHNCAQPLAINDKDLHWEEALSWF